MNSLLHFACFFHHSCLFLSKVWKCACPNTILSICPCAYVCVYSCGVCVCVPVLKKRLSLIFYWKAQKVLRREEGRDNFFTEFPEFTSLIPINWLKMTPTNPDNNQTIKKYLNTAFNIYAAYSFDPVPFSLFAFSANDYHSTHANVCPLFLSQGQQNSWLGFQSQSRHFSEMQSCNHTKKLW